MINAQERVGQPGAGLSGTVRVVCPDGFGAFLFAPAVGSLNQRHPRLIIEIITATTHLPQTARDFDVAVTLEEPSSPRMLKRRLSEPELEFYGTYWLVIPPEYSRLARVLAVTDVIDDVIRNRAADMLGGSRRRRKEPGLRTPEQPARAVRERPRSAGS